ncbi:MAG: hypothetical protein AAGD07_25345 [Planctomycetota bacterium]
MRNYDTRRLELIAVIMALEYFRLYIEGHRVRLQTDHRNLTYLMRYKGTSPQMVRWAQRLSEFNIELDYCPGKSNAMRVPDCLSRNLVDQLIETDEEGQPVNEAFLIVSEIPTPTHGCHVVLSYARGPSSKTDDQSAHAYVAAETVPELEHEANPEPVPTPFNLVDQVVETVTVDEIRDHQQGDPVCKRAKEQLPSGVRTRSKGRATKRNYDLENGVLYHIDHRNQRRQIVIPATLKRKLFRQAHEGPLNGHLGRDATVEHLLQRFWWPMLQNEVAQFIAECMDCKKAKTSIPYRQGLLQQPPRIADGHTLGMDLVGPLPESDGKRFILTMIDPFSHFLTLEAIDSKKDTCVCSMRLSSGYCCKGTCRSSL